MKITKLLLALVCSMVLFTFSSCESDDSLSHESPEEAYIAKAKDILVGDIVLSTKATMNGVDKTLLPTGCPTKFNFTWKEDGMMTINLVDFHVGAMPFDITFRCACKLMKLNKWERDEYTGEGWIKFVGKDGNVTNNTDHGDTQQGSGATVQGYLNVLTMQTSFIINYNVMNVRTETFMQPIDKDRVKNFEAEFAQYEKDLAKYKEDHHLN